MLHSTEVNLSPRGEVDMDAAALAELDIVLGSFHSSLRKTDDQTPRYLAALRNPSIHTLGHPKGEFTITGWARPPIGRECLQKQPSSIKP